MEIASLRLPDGNECQCLLSQSWVLNRPSRFDRSLHTVAAREPIGKKQKTLVMQVSKPAVTERLQEFVGGFDMAVLTEAQHRQT
ncbi:MAG: hypothetical protein ACTHK7_23330 [Aureliella sp.]